MKLAYKTKKIIIICAFCCFVVGILIGAYVGYEQGKKMLESEMSTTIKEI